MKPPQPRARKLAHRHGHIPVVGIGASAGGVEAMIELFGALPADLGAAVLVVLHLGPGASGMLPHILARSGALPAVTAVDGDPLEAGRVYVAPPDRHLLVTDGHVFVSQGPRENFHRPSIDVLFRSLAEVAGPRSIGVLLSGTRTDGTSGLAAIASRGGATIVQSPLDALFPDLPSHAIGMDVAQHVVDAAAVGPLLATLIEAMPAALPARKEGAMESTLVTVHGSEGSHPPGRPAAFGCPECGGALYELDDDRLLRFRCRIGHGYNAEDLLVGQRTAVENAFWTAIRALEESAELNDRLAERSSQRGHRRAAGAFSAVAEDCRRKSGLLRDTLGDAVPDLHATAASA